MKVFLFSLCYAEETRLHLAIHRESRGDEANRWTYRLETLCRLDSRQLIVAYPFPISSPPIGIGAVDKKYEEIDVTAVYFITRTRWISFGNFGCLPNPENWNDRASRNRIEIVWNI